MVDRLSKTAVVPCETWGGGERAVLEARACGLEVEVNPANAKLLELLNVQPIPDEYTYAEGLQRGFIRFKFMHE